MEQRATRSEWRRASRSLRNPPRATPKSPQAGGNADPSFHLVFSQSPSYLQIRVNPGQVEIRAPTVSSDTSA